MTLKNLIQRALTGVLFVAVIVAAICIHPLLFAGIFSIIVGALIYEFGVLSKFGCPFWQRCLGIGGGMYLFFASCLFAGGYVGHAVYLAYIIILLVLLISVLYMKDHHPVAQMGLVLFSQFYCAGLLSLLSFIPYMQSTVYNPLPVLMIFVFIWLNDTGAYLIGSWIGKHRLFERISPLKSWEGFFGGFAVVIIASLVCAHFYTELQWYYWLAFAVITVVSATWGDLLESLLKRTYGVKDTGKILPGHGGMLDRFDSAILAAPVVYIFFELIMR
jgi:phosphatidate cytidylyltransferase